jgi:hypothetical protein
VAALTVSPSATYRFADTAGATPFLRAGYTLVGVDGVGAGGPNIGGGVVRWFGNGGGIVVEFRGVIYRAYETEHWWTFRVGFTFR